jgi:hypothetical protein
MQYYAARSARRSLQPSGSEAFTEPTEFRQDTVLSDVMAAITNAPSAEATV